MGCRVCDGSGSKYLFVGVLGRGKVKAILHRCPACKAGGRLPSSLPQIPSIQPELEFDDRHRDDQKT